ncbi:MAG TPA: hypothetical protein VEA15_03305 [Caulobacteraceae bacterium]|nr:hypothetical protein [Caulobacteraceae bacterium]
MAEETTTTHTPTSAATTHTTTTRSGSGSGPWLALLVGGLLVVVALIAWFMMSGGQTPEAPSIPENVNVDVNVPEVPAPSAPAS